MCLKLKTMIKNQENISTYDVSQITNMSYLFYNTPYNKEKHGDISNWNVSNVENMNCMFNNGDIPCLLNWDISKIKTIINFGIANIKNKNDFLKYQKELIAVKKLGLFGNLIHLE